MEHGQQHGGPVTVVTDVRGGVGEVEAEPDHGCLVAHGVDAGERGAHGVGVTNVRSVNLDAAGGPRDGRRAVEHTDFVAGVHEGVDHVRPDESGPAGDEDAHYACPGSGR